MAYEYGQEPVAEYLARTWEQPAAGAVGSPEWIAAEEARRGIPVSIEAPEALAMELAKVPTVGGLEQIPDGGEAMGNGYTGVGIFPWQTPPGVGFRAPWTPKNGGDVAQDGQEVPADAGALGFPLAMGLTLPLTGLLGVAGGVATAGGHPAIGAGLTGAGALLAAGEDASVVNGIPISGPGVPEPPRYMVAKQWVTLVSAKDIGNYYVYFFKLIDGRIMCYNPRMREWKIWRPKKHIVISSNPRMKTLSKLSRLNKRVEKMLKPYQPKAKGGLSARALARTYLSTAERRMLAEGGK